MICRLQARPGTFFYEDDGYLETFLLGLLDQHGESPHVGGCMGTYNKRTPQKQAVSQTAAANAHAV